MRRNIYHNGRVDKQRPNSVKRNRREHLDFSEYFHLLNKSADNTDSYLIFNATTPKIEHCSTGIKDLLGFQPKNLTISNLLRLIHPEDAPLFLANEFKISHLFTQLPQSDKQKYRVTQTVRLKHARGHYVRILKDIVFMRNESQDDDTLRAFVILSEASGDITNNQLKIFKIEQTPLLTFNDANQLDRPPDTIDPLTIREHEVLRLISQNMSTKEIAEKLSRSPHTIKNHRKNMLRKTGADNSLDLVMTALQKGWV